MPDDSRVVIQFVGSDAGLTATAGAINQQLGALAASAAKLNTALGESASAATAYGQGLKGTATDAEKLFQTTARLTQQRVKEEFQAQAAAAKELAAAERAQQVEAEKLFQTNARLTQQNVAEDLQKQVLGYQTLTLATGAAAAGIGALFAKGVEDFKTFSGSITELGVVTSTTGTERLSALRTEIERLAAVTSETPTQVAALATALARAGFDADKVKDALAGVVKGAEATNTVPVTFGKVVGAVIESFRLQASESGKVSDALVAGANVAGLKIDELGEAFKRSGPTASQANQSYKETIATLGVLRASNLEGSIAGTGLVAILDRLKTSSAAADSQFATLVRGSAKMIGAFKAIQVDARNADGSMKPLSETIPKIQTSLQTFSQQDQDVLKKALFGEQGSAAFNAYISVSKDRIDQITTAVDNSAGASASASKVLTGDLAGSFRILEGTTQLASIKFGEFVGVGLLPVVKGANDLINVFLALPAPVQNVLIGLTGFVGILAAAASALFAFQLARSNGVVVATLETAAETYNTIAVNANAAAKFLAAAATGTLTEAQTASAAAFLSTAATAGLAAGAIASIALAVDTFGKVNAAADQTRSGIADFDKALQALNETEAKSTDASNAHAAALTLEAAAQKRVADSIGPVQQGLDFIRRLSGDATAAEVATNNVTIAFTDVLGTADTVETQFKKLFAGGRSNATKQEVEGLNATIAASLKAIESLQPANQQDVQDKQLRINRLKELQKELANTGKAETAAAAGKGKSSAPDVKAEAATAKAEDQDAKAKADAAHQDEQQQKDQEYQDAKALRAQTFQDAQQVIDRKNQQAKEDRAAAFQDAQALVDRKNQDEKQARQTAYDEAKTKASEARDEAKRKSEEARTANQTAAGNALSLEGSRGNARTNLLNQGATTAAVGKLSDKDIQNLSPEQLAALAKRTAGVGNINNARDEEKAQFALKAITARQDKLQKELDRKDDEAYKAKLKKEDAAFKLAERAIDDKLAEEKKVAARKEKVAEQAIDDKLALEKRNAVRAEALKEREFDRQHENDKRAEERAFKQAQREQDRENAKEVKRILESTKIPAPATPSPVPRLLGGPVSPGILYLGGEKGTEGIDFGGGKAATVGNSGAQLFQVAQHGTVHPAGSAFTDRVVQATFNQPINSRSGAGATVQTIVVNNGDDAMLKELRSLREQVERFRPIDQTFHISEEFPLDKVHSAMRYAARLR